MKVLSRFKFDHEEGDSPRDAALIEKFKRGGVELGADVTLWYCEPCDFARGDFAYPERER